MKKLALAPALALAITGLAASPVIAAPNTDAFGQTNVQGAQNGAGATETEEPTEDAEAQKLEAKVSVSPEKISQSDLADKENAVTVTITGLEAGDVISDNISYREGESDTAEGDTFSYTIYNQTGDPAAIDPGEVNFTVYIKRGDETQEVAASFTVTEDGDSDEPEAPEVDPKAKLDAKEITVSEFEKDGLKFTGEGFTPNGTVSIQGEAVQSQSAAQADELKADENGTVSGSIGVAEGTAEPGTYTVTFIDDESGEKTDAIEFSVTADETEDPTTPAAEAKLTVSPETVTPADFVKKDKGVTLAVENCEPGADVRYLVTPKGESNVTAYDNTVKADDEGKASVNVYGTSASDPSAYLGDYDVTVTCGDEELTGEFSVEDDANAGGSDGNEDGNDNGNGDGGNGGGDLPRTGAELTGLVGGAALLLIGGTAVALTMRRKKVAQDPSEI